MRLSRLSQVVPHLEPRPRVAIVGGPAAGKSTLAAQISRALGGVPVRATDLMRDIPWSAQSAGTADWLRSPGPQIVEGVAVVRGLRRMLQAGEHPRFVVVKLPPGDSPLAKGVETIWAEVAPELRRRGVPVIEVE